MKTIIKMTTALILTMIVWQGKAQISFTVTNLSGPNVITCANTSLYFNANAAISGVTFSWTGPGLNTTGNNVIISSPGNYNVIAISGSSTSSQVFSIGINTIAPSATLTPASQNIACTPSSVTQVTVVASNTNCSSSFMNPSGGSLVFTSSPSFYSPYAAGIHTCVVTDNVNGCSAIVTLTATTTAGLPTFSLASPENFTLGCASKSVASINFLNATTTNSNGVPTGGAVGFTLMSLGNSTGPGTLSSMSSYTVSTPGTWIAVVR